MCLSELFWKSEYKKFRQFKRSSSMWVHSYGSKVELEVFHIDQCHIFVWKQNSVKGFSGGSGVKNRPANAEDVGLIPASARFPWRRKWQPTPVILPGKSHGQRSQAGYSPWGSKRVGHTEQLSDNKTYSQAHSALCSAVTPVSPNSVQPCGPEPTRLPCPWNFSGNNAGVCCHFLLHRIFRIQGLNLHLLCLLHCRQILYHWATWEAQSEENISSVYKRD